MSRFLTCVVLLVGLFVWLSDFISSGRFLARIDAMPDRRGMAVSLFALGNGYELLNRNEKAVEYYRRIVQRFPHSRYAMDAHYSLGESYEHLKEYSKAVEVFQAFLKKYPKSKYGTIIQNDLGILGASAVAEK